MSVRRAKVTSIVSGFKPTKDLLSSNPVKTDYWLTLFGGTSNQTPPYAITVSKTSGKVIGAGSYPDSIRDHANLAQFTTAGALDWQYQVPVGSSTDNINQITTDYSGNIIAAGYSNQTGTQQEHQLTKFDSTGAIIWSRSVRFSGGQGFNSVSVDRNNNIYATGRNSGGATYYKYDSSGTIVQVKRFGGDVSAYSYDIAADNFGAAYIATTLNNNRGLITKINSGNNFEWSYLVSSTDYVLPTSVEVDAEGNLYVFGTVPSPVSTTGRDVWIAKFTSTGVLCWSRRCGNASSATNWTMEQTCGTVDGNGNSFITTATSSINGIQEAYLLKYNTDGVLQWQRRIYSNSSTYGINTTKKPCVDFSGTFYAQLSVRYATGATNTNWLMCKIPNSGSGTGTYVLNGETIVYATTTALTSASYSPKLISYTPTTQTDAYTTYSPTQSQITQSYLSYNAAITY